jgi:hypothetical protein
MRSNRLALVVPFLLLCLAACGGKGDSAATSGGHAPAGAVPGSHEDWCGAHAVPESKCTRCNPALIPAFKATNDWCAEHALPESQCLICHPNLKIERPPKTAGG